MMFGQSPGYKSLYTAFQIFDFNTFPAGYVRLVWFPPYNPSEIEYLDTYRKKR